MMNTTFGKKLTIALALVASWAALLWINFSAQLSVAMHYVAIPFLLVVITGYCAYHLEQSIYGKETELCH